MTSRPASGARPTESVSDNPLALTGTESSTGTTGDQGILTKRPISHDEAQEIAQRLINSHFRQEPHARIGIPARPNYDDDLLIRTYIRQQRAAHDDLVKALQAILAQHDIQPFSFPVMPCIKQARAALAKAGGAS